MSTAVMLNNNVGMPNNTVAVGPGAMVRHAAPAHPSPVHSSGGTITVTNVPFGGPTIPGNAVAVGIRHQQQHHPHPPAPAPPTPAPVTHALPGAPSTVSVPSASAMEVEEEVDTTPLTAAELQILSDIDR